MAPKEQKAKAPVSTGSRRSTRLSVSAPPPSKDESKKRPSETNGAPSSKKSKPSAAAEKEEKKAEAPKDAKPTEDKAALKIGDALPSIKLQDNEGNEVDIAALGDKGVVFFLYPKADTPGCTTQACGYRDIHDDIVAQGYEVYGLSKDKPAAQQRWKEKKELNYKLLCDPESKLIKKLGAFVAPAQTKRSHFIFEKGSGKLVDAKVGVKPADDPSNVLNFIKSHHK